MRIIGLFRPAEEFNVEGRSCALDLLGFPGGDSHDTTWPARHRALVESTAFGALTVINRFEEYGMAVRDVVNCGGIAEKNPFVMQIYADICNRPMKISRSAQTCALGAAIFGAVAGGAYKTVGHAQRQMTGVKDTVYRPNKSAAKTYAELYRLYRLLHDAFGTTTCSEQLHRVMKELTTIRGRVRREAG